MSVQRAAIVGVGLIGGSLAAAWRQAGFAAELVGVEPDAEAARLALELGLVDRIEPAVPADAQLIAICTPSDMVAAQIMALAGHAGVLFDVGSVKGPIVTRLQDAGGVPPRYIPSHPIAGAEFSGPGAAQADLFVGATTVITPERDADPDAIALVTAAWEAAGTTVACMEAGEHDAMLAVTSHLPHALAFAFMQQVSAEQLPFTGGGFRDFTRIAAASPELWWRIFQMNKQALLNAGARLQADLDALLRAVQEGDEPSGRAALQRAVELRQLLDADHGAQAPADTSDKGAAS